jgi:hypothetical protein
MKGSENLNCAPSRLCWGQQRLRLGLLFCGGLLLLSPVRAGTQQDHSQQDLSQPGRSQPSQAQKAGDGQSPSVKAESLNAERKKQIADDSARLLKLATDLKAEVDKTTKDTLSIGVIRKADAIEKLARAVKEQARPAAGLN